MYETITACIPVHLLDKIRLAKFNAVCFYDNTALMIIIIYLHICIESTTASVMDPYMHL